MIFTSESVTPGHPDKLCDQISDAIVDAHLAGDPHARVAAEVMATARGITVAGEITSTADVDLDQVVRETVAAIGYTHDSGLAPETVPVQDQTTRQSPQIASAVNNRARLGAGDQGMMFGYATNETAMLMPLPLMLARAITQHMVAQRESKGLPWLRPDGKAQVTVRTDEEGRAAVQAVVVSTQHHPDISLTEVREALVTHVVEPALAEYGLGVETGTTLHLNPAGAWTLGGPQADTGLTGRKIMVDTYGGMARHGGGAFSGKDATKVDRSGAYAARHAARLLVQAGHASRVEVQLSYAIGVSAPVSVMVATPAGPSRELADLLTNTLDFTPDAIIDRFGLTRPLFAPTAAAGHFGHPQFPWEAE